MPPQSGYRKNLLYSDRFAARRQEEKDDSHPFFNNSDSIVYLGNRTNEKLWFSEEMDIYDFLSMAVDAYPHLYLIWKDLCLSLRLFRQGGMEQILNDMEKVGYPNGL
jgi:hypothetical protein